MENTIVHFDLMVGDTAKAKAFYGRIFDWSFKAWGEGDEYELIQTGDDPEGGLMKKPEQAPRPMCNIYVQVQSIDETLDKVIEGGGAVLVPKTPIEGMGYFAVFMDPDAISMGLFEPS